VSRSWFVRRMWMAWVAAMLAGLLAAVVPWLDRLRPVPIELQAALELHVTNGADSGAASLRETILRADRVDGRARIVIDVPVVTISSPLPPILNPAGVVFEGRRPASRIDAAGLSAGPVLDVSAPNTVLSLIEITGAPREAILLRSSGARVTGVRLRQDATGIYLADGADDLTVSESEFDRNTIGIQLPSDARSVRISNSHFQGHARAGIWSTAPSAPPVATAIGIHILANRFDADAAGLVLLNTPARVERNTFVGARTAALLMSGAAMIIRSNRVRSGFGFAIDSDGLDQALIADNEIDHNCSGGILVRNARNTQVLSNRLYSNGYGVVVILGSSSSPSTVADNLIVRHLEDGLFVIGASPLIRRNRLMDNRRAAVRLVAWRADGNQLRVPRPLLDANVFAGNGVDVPPQDVYRASAASGGTGSPADCSWRNGADVNISGR